MTLKRNEIERELNKHVAANGKCLNSLILSLNNKKKGNLLIGV